MCRYDSGPGAGGIEDRVSRDTICLQKQKEDGEKIILVAYTQVTPEEAKELRPTVLFVDVELSVT